MVPVRGKLFLFVLIGCLISCAESLLFDVKRSFEGELFPADRDVCTTQSVTFTSVLNQEPETSYSIGFTVKTRETHGKFVTADRNKITYINDTMAKYVYDVPPLKDVETPTYFYVKSYYWQKLGDDNKKLQIGKTTAARVYPYPEKVVDFDCIVNNYATMICSWKYGRDYGIHMPEVIFKWKIPSYTSSWTDCWYVNEEKGLCTWNETQTGFFYNSNITISLTLKQKCDINVTSQFHVDTSKIVKPNPVSSMKLSVINSTCITLLWNTTESGQYHPKEHLIIVSSRGVYIMNTTLITTIVSEQLEHKEMFCSLRPYTEYSFNVSIKPTGTYSGFFSDPVQKTAKTYSDIPSGSPGVTEGGYSIHHRDCEDGRKRRRVCLFWKPIETEHENGPMKGLLGNFLTIPQTPRSIKEDWAEDVTYGCSDILCDKRYLFTIKARNINGTSTQESTVTIPAFSRGTVRPDFIVESTNSSDVHISWTYTGSDRASSFLVAWCRNENGDCKPGHEVGWKQVNVNVTEIILQIDMPQDYLYGVSALIGENDSTGVEWQDCVYLKDSKPERRPQNVVVSNGAADNSLVVTWDKLACTSNEPYIDMYNIEYYKEEDKQRRSINVSQSGKARLELKDLDEGQSYVLTVRGVTKNGMYGPESQPQSGVPVNKSLKPSEIVGITLTVLVCFIFAGIGVVCAVWRCKKKAQEAIKQAGNITIPEAPEPENSTSLLRRASEDSGYDQTPPSDKINAEYKLRNPLSNLPYDYRCVVVGQSDTIEGTGSSTFPVTHTPHNTLSRKLDLFTGLSKPDICKGKQRSKLSLNIPKPIAFTSESELYWYKQDDGNVTNDSSREKRIDCEKSSKSLGSLLDPNHNSIQYLHVLSSDGIPDRSKEKDTASTLDLDTQAQSSSCILSNDQHVTNIPCINGQFRNENNLVMDKDEPVPIFTIENGQEIVDDRPCIDTHTLCYQCQECVTNGLSNNPSNKHYNTQFPDSSYVFTTELQTCVIQTYPVFESVNSELTGSIAPQPQDAGKMSLTIETVQASEKVIEPSAPTLSQAIQSFKKSSSFDDTYFMNIPEKVEQESDRASDINITMLQNRFISGINYSVDPEENDSPVSSFDDDILFSSIEKNPEIADTSGYIPHSQIFTDKVKRTYSPDSINETCQERTVNIKQYIDEQQMDLRNHIEAEQGQSLSQTQQQSFA